LSEPIKLDKSQELKEKINTRFSLIYNGFQALKAKGLPVDIIAPEGAIYLSAQFKLIGKTTPAGNTISGTQQITSYLLNEAQLAAVPFTAFGAQSGTDWYRLSVGTIKAEEIPDMLNKLESALSKLHQTIRRQQIN
jgi:aspartate aminotransferase